MNLFINSPTYYTQKHGVDDDIYKFCSFISRNIDVTKYTEYLDTIGIVPIIAPIDAIDDIKQREDRHISTTYRFASISLLSDYDTYHSSDLVGKRQIIVDNILRSLKVVKTRLKGKFNYDLMEKDIKYLAQKFGENSM